MDTIGGFFCIEPLNENENYFLKNICPKEGELTYLMSGRCGIYYALEDIKLTDKKKVAYVPVYTCETVLAPFEKAGYELIFYGIDKNMTPIFDISVLERISVISICGYYGFCNYDKEFVKKCKEKGITIIEDTTHSIFSRDGVDPNCDYIVGSLRKWIGVPSGGFAIKTKGKFSVELQKPNNKHLSMRSTAMKAKEDILKNPQKHDEKDLEMATSTFWDAEMMLRQIFDTCKSDELSIKIMNHFNVQSLINKRRANYQYLLDNMKPDFRITVVFPKLTAEAVPSHFTLYADDRDKTQKYLLDNGIHTTAYWPKGPLTNVDNCPEASYIYDHVFSIPCDQRYDEKHMQYICDVLEKLPK